MNPTGSANSQQPQHNIQHNAPGSGGTVYAHQGPGPQIINVPPSPTAAAKRRAGTDTKVLLVALVADVAFFFYGMLSYTGRNTAAETWRAFIFLAMLAVTGGMLRRWLHRRT
jgi:hypothetical protein